MNSNFVYVKDNVISKKDCDYIINFFNNKVIELKNIEAIENVGYDYIDIEEYNVMNFLKPICNDHINIYKKKYPQSNLTASQWSLANMRFKKYRPNRFFKSWHSEHSLNSPYRVLNIMIYLSNHNCGTEFFNGKIIKSKIGRLCIFPSYFTHTHRGQVCPDKKERYLLSGYYSFNKIGNKETSII